MSRYYLNRRRLATVAGGALVLSAMAGTLFAGPAFADGGPAEVAGTPCDAAAQACVDLDAQKAWLIRNGQVIRGPVAIASGGDGAETPAGDTFRVYRKDKDHKSQEFLMPNGQPAPMPYSVFFEDGGIAFHAGDPDKASAGCVHLALADAEAFFSTLNVGDHVQVKKGSDDNGGDDNNGDDNNGDNGDSGDNGGSRDDGGDSGDDAGN
ncbi:MAG TPA: L,D-transpeptidase [Pseudonocardia sp.]|jgi:hypothetical protein|nr:L,D-transpeptidase [Pseudonocardia sp.]